MSSSQHTVCGIDLIGLLEGAHVIGDEPIRVTSICNDSRVCQPGDLYVALPGTRTDGHHHVKEAIARGATAVLAERLLPVADLPMCIVPDARVAYGQLCHTLSGNPSRQVKVIGVTGTNGKTTTSHLIASVLEAGGQSTGLMGTLGYYDGFSTSAAPLTTPSAPTLSDTLARMQANQCSHAVIEMSSHALAQRRTAGIELDVACVTNVKRDHLDFHNTLPNYRAAKARIFDHLRDDSLVVLNVDDPVSRDFLQTLNNPVLSIGMHETAEVSATVIERFRSEQTFMLTAGNDTVPVRTHIIGDQHVYNCLEAAAVGLGYGIDLSTIVRGLEAVTELPGRLQRIECGQPFGVYVDYAHTPDALAQSLSTLREVTQGKVICVFGAGGERDREKRPQMGHAVEQVADLAIVTDDNPRSEDPSRIIRDIVSGFEGFGGLEVVPNRQAAIQMALATAEPGDSVIITGKGHETCQIIGTQRFQFDDRVVAKKYLREMAVTKTLFSVPRRAA